MDSAKPYEDYVELDLGATLERGDQAEYALFEMFFHADAFRADSVDGDNASDRELGVYQCGLDRRRLESEAVLEERVKAPLLAQVDEVMQYLCNGFIFDTRKSGADYSEEERRQIFESAVKLLYRCLFLFYAESRSLLPSEQGMAPAYTARSIRALCLKARGLQWGEWDDNEGYSMWQHLKGLINAVNDGDPEYGIFGYNGGLFD